MPSHRPLRPVALILRRRVKPGCRGEFESALQRLVKFAFSTRGHLDVHVLCRVQDSADDYIVVHRFADAAGRQEFTGSPAYRDWLRRLHELTDESPLCPDLTELAFPASGSDRVTEVYADLRLAPPNPSAGKNSKLVSRQTSPFPAPSDRAQTVFLLSLLLIGMSAEVLEGMALGWIPIPPFNLTVALAIGVWLAALAFCLGEARELYHAIPPAPKRLMHPAMKRAAIRVSTLESSGTKR